MEQPSNETIILKYIASHKGSLAVEIYKGINAQCHSISINTIRRFLRKLIKEKKVTRTGVHAFRYQTKK